MGSSNNRRAHPEKGSGRDEEMKNVYVVGGDRMVIDMFERRGWTCWYSAPEVCQEVTGYMPDLICFTGGADINPALYGQEPSPKLGRINQTRDDQEVMIFEMFKNKVPMVGICRGGQLLNVLNGGSMIQHIEGHLWGDREVIFQEGEEPFPRMKLREDHHQGMISAIDGMILAFDPRDQNQEIILYEKTSCLCFQAHPEWDHGDTEQVFFDHLLGCLG